MDNNNIPKTDREWREKLTPQQYKVLREKGTEAPFSGQYVHRAEGGVYKCVACGNPLFKTDAQFDSGTGWPSFDQAISGSIKQEKDSSYGMPARLNDLSRSGGNRTEVLCAKCGSHLGHLFEDGPTVTGQRYCMNSVCLNLEKTDEAK